MIGNISVSMIFSNEGMFGYPTVGKLDKEKE